MNKRARVVVMGCSLIMSFALQAQVCPDPNSSSLQWGEPPAPWTVSPFSMNSPQGEENTTFVRANILVAGLGRGVACTYKNSVGLYTIWWPVLVKVPSRNDYRWIDTVGGFVCTGSVDYCEFSAAE
ncbi:DUF3757 domain-containing protein [Legionella spiritensis]|uniref:DUF3757 domain-containing protein n=1 Tax=Legionella spiritensis TaxID=452 RepID=A0A0W0YXN5_LEGSP|nr:hypothetical protein Lspi_2258 [Legionella spiritensis]SNV39307.1 Uncharacterised protein [Legionella spiritensis]